eukprot:UN26849
MGGRTAVTNLHATELAVEVGETVTLSFDSDLGSYGFVHVAGGTLSGATTDSSCGADVKKVNWSGASAGTIQYTAPDSAGNHDMTIAISSGPANGVEVQIVPITVTAAEFNSGGKYVVKIEVQFIGVSDDVDTAKRILMEHMRTINVKVCAVSRELLPDITFSTCPTPGIILIDRDGHRRDR